MRNQGVIKKTNRRCDLYYASLGLCITLAMASSALHAQPAQLAQDTVTLQDKYDVSALSPETKTLPKSQPALKAADHTLTSSEAAIYAYAQQLYDNKRYAAAFGRFARLADAGHAPSAKKALAMLSNTPVKLNGNWTATIDQQNRWSQLAQSTPQANLAALMSQTGD
jgi:hypothetical protein